MKKLWMFFVFVPGIAFATDDCATLRNVPDTVLTLPQVVNFGLCRNPQTAAAYASYRSAHFTKNSAYSSYLPKVDFSGGSARAHRVHDDWDYSGSLSASYLIFDFGRRSSDFATQLATYRAAGFDYDETIQNYIYSVIGAYYELLNANADVTAAESALKVAQTAKDTADKKFKAGAVAKADVYKAETTLASAQLKLERAKNNREITKGTLLTKLSFPANQEITIADMPSTFGSDAESEDIEKLLDVARKKRPDLLKATANKDAAWHRRNTAFLKNLPSVSVTANVNMDAKSMGGLFEHMHERAGGRIGVSVSMPIFAGFANMYNVRAAAANYDSATETERAVKNNAMMDVFTAYQNYKTAKTVLEQTDTLLKSATENERVTSGMYKVGRSTMLDWQQAQSDLIDARNQNNAAKYDLYIKRAAVALAIGDIESGLDGEINVK
ncbi:MAG: TolC family protein [Alphaproteobacteria bacterium]|nr:TolC family protein [Alphaproteobacteria bacterium]